MTIEEKAKAYDEALKRADRVSKGKADDREPGTTICEYIFPELKTSKYESIRNGLIALLKCGLEDGSAIAPGFNVTKEQALAWLESQCKQSVEPKWCHHKVDVSDCSEEYRKAYYDGWNNCNMQHSQCKSELDDVVKCLINGMKFYYEGNEEATWGTDKWSIPVKHIIEVLERQSKQPTDKVETKFKEGDYIVPNDITFPETWRVVNIDKDDYYNIQCITNPEYDEIYRVPGFVLEKDYHLWSINDAKCGDVLVASDGSLFILSKVVDTAAFHYFSLCKNGSKEIGDGNHAWESVRGCHPATKEERELLYAKMKESGWEWDSEKKELKKTYRTI